MRILLAIISTLLMSATLGHDVGQAQLMRTAEGSPVAYTHGDIMNRLEQDVKILVAFYRDASHRMDLDVALSTLVEDLAEKGYSLKSSPEDNSIRIGVRRYDLGTYNTAHHFITSDGNLWLDIVTYPDVAAIRAFWETFKGSQWYSGFRNNKEWIFHTFKSPKNSAVEVIFHSDTEVINIGVSLPIAIPNEISELSQSDLQCINARIDTLYEVTRLLIQHLVSDEDLAMMPLPGGQLTALQRIVGFVHLWSEVKYNFVFFDQVPQLNWDSILHQYLPRVEREQTAEEYYRLLQECIALLHDGHSDVWAPTSRMDSPPVRIQPVQEKAIIVQVGQTEELVQAELKPGVEVTHIDGRSVHDILDQDIYLYISASTHQGRDLAAYGKLLEGPKGTRVSLVVRGIDGATRTVTLTRRSENEQMPWRNRPILEYQDLSEGIVYVALNSFRSDKVVKQFDKIFEKVQQAKGLILDVRENGGGTTRNELIGFLIDKPVKGSRWRTRQYMPVFRASGKEEKWYEGGHSLWEPRGERSFLGPVVVLIGPRTASAAEDFLIPLHESGRATLVGEKTAGTTGQPLYIRLPGGGGARICTKRETYPDGREFVGIGIVPDVEVYLSQEDIASGYDSVLERGLQVLKSQLK